VTRSGLDSGGAFDLHIIHKLRVAMVEGELFGRWFGQLLNFLKHPLEGHIAQLDICLRLGTPTTTNITVVSREPDFLDIFGLGALDDFVIILSEECRLELEAAFVDGNCMANMGSSWNIDREILLPRERNFENTN